VDRAQTARANRAPLSADAAIRTARAAARPAEADCLGAASAVAAEIDAIAARPMRDASWPETMPKLRGHLIRRFLDGARPTTAGL
jgi:hypothetical protein